MAALFLAPATPSEVDKSDVDRALLGFARAHPDVLTLFDPAGP